MPEAAAMDPYDRSLVPAPFGLRNTGVICYLNSFLQALMSCPSLSRAIIENRSYLLQTRTGSAMLNFIEEALDTASNRVNTARQDLENMSFRVLSALQADLRERRPNVTFGGTQESASEALVHLLDMMEPPRPPADETTAKPTPGSPPSLSASPGPDGPAVHSAESPITRLFLHRFRCDLHCRQCKKIVSKETDYAVNFNLFHIDRLKQIATADAFSKALRLHISMTEDYKCQNCNQKTTGFRVYNLTMVPEIVFCMFNLYVGYGGTRRVRYFPDQFEIPERDGGRLVFRAVAQVEHSGSLSGGHYWARALRAGGVYLLNDTGVSDSRFAATPNTYIVVYHYDRTVPPEA